MFIDISRFCKLINNNLSWQLSEKVIRIITGVVSNVLIAKALGVNGMGVLSFFQAVLALLFVFSSFNVDPFLIIEYSKVKRLDLFQSNFVFRFYASVFVFIVAYLFIKFGGFFKIISPYLILILTSLIFNVFESFKVYYESQSLTWIYSRAIIASSVLVLLARILFIKLGLIEIEYFLFLIPLELFICFLLVCVSDKKVLEILSFDIKKIKKLIPFWHNGSHLYLSSLAIFIYMKIDAIMIGSLTSVDQVGIYSIACKLTEGWYFIPSVLYSIYFPKLIGTKLEDLDYTGNYGYYFRISNLVCLLISGLSVLVVPVFVKIFYSANFFPVILISNIHIWTLVFVNVGVQSGIYILKKGDSIFFFKRAICGAIINIFLNYILIPKYGALGASVATLISQFFSAFFVDVFFEKYRILFWFKLKTFNFNFWSSP